MIATLCLMNGGESTISMKVSVIIPNWNGKKFLKDCLDSLAAQSFRDLEVVLVDNGSRDGSADYVRDQYPWVKLVALPENLGFAAGNNRGLEECRGEYIVALNNDTKVEPGFLAAMVEAADSAPEVGMVAAKMLNFFETNRIDSVGMQVARNGLGYNIGFGEQDEGQYDKPAEVFGPCGGAALYRREMISQVGFFDPDFFAYYEDFDLAWRGRLAGWRCVTAPKAIVYHVHSATSGEWSPFKVYYTHRNKWFSLLKNWPGSILWRYLPLLAVYDLGALVLALLKGNFAAACRARKDALSNLKRLLNKRREVQGHRVLSVAEVACLFSPHEGFLKTFSRKVRK